MNILIIILFLAVIAGLAYLSLGVGAAIFGYSMLKAKIGGGTSYRPPAAPPGSTTGWTIAWSKNMPAQMANNGDGTFSFTFPNQDGVHYVYKAADPLAQSGQKITMRFSLTGTGTIVPASGSGSGTPAVRLFLQRAGDNMGAVGDYQYYRWWSNPGNVELTSTGDFTLEVALAPDQWSSVMGVRGENAANQFGQALASCANIGFTFGAMFFGHGVFNTGGTMKFTLKEYTIS